MRPRQLRRRLAASALSLAVVVGCGTYWAAEAAAAPSVCASLAAQPTVPTVEGLVLAFMDDGWTPEESGEIIARAVYSGCPVFGRVLDAFIAKWSDARGMQI